MDNKKIISVLLALTMTGVFSGCSNNSNTPTVSDENDITSYETTSSEETSGNEIIATGHVKTNSEYAELKESTDMNSGTIIRVYNDYDVNVYRMEKDWYFCNCDGFDGYLKAEYVEFGEKQTEAVTSEEVTETSVEITTTTAAAVTKDIRVNENLTDIDYYVNAYAYANIDSSLAVRSGPSTDYKKIGTLYKGDSMYVYHALTNSRGYTWYYVSVGNIEGYVIAKYTTFNYDDISYQPEYNYTFDAYVSTKQGSNLNLRDTPNGKIIKKIPNNEYVLVCDTSNSSWWYVYYNGTYGYASSEYLVPCFNDGAEKPVIYLYPEEKTDVSIKLNLKGTFMFTYPEYRDGWNVTAYPDGSITDEDGNNYSYIFWDAIMYDKFDFSTGFVVEGKDTLEFLKEKLDYMGLNEKEKNEFIVYWVPRMMNNKYNLISFQMQNYDDMAKLTVKPEPDSILRVFMAFKPLNEYTEIPEQKLERFERKGFTLIEWGGTEIK